MNERVPEPVVPYDFHCPYCENLQYLDELIPIEEDYSIIWKCAFCKCNVGVNDFVLIEVYA